LLIGGSNRAFEVNGRVFSPLSIANLEPGLASSERTLIVYT